MLSCKYGKFTIDPGITYLNCAYMSPLLKKSEKAGIRGIRLKRNPADITPEMFFEDSSRVRTEFARIINVSEPGRIAIIPSVSYGMAIVAANLPLEKGEEIIVAAEQFPSNVYPWQKLCSKTGGVLKTISPPDENTGRGREWNTRILEAINPKTKAVAIAQVHWADGTRFNLEAIRQRTREVGALLIIDGTQSVGALPFDVSRIAPDALVCAGYKWLLGPYGLGLAYFGEYFNNGKPIEENWINRLNSENFSQLVNYQPEYLPGSQRFEVGEHSNFILLPMLLKSLEQINKWGVPNIQEYCRTITTSPLQLLLERGFWVEEEEWRSAHLFGIRPPAQGDVDRIRQHLVKKHFHVSFRGNAIRVSPNVYNRSKDVEKLVQLILSA